MAIAGAAGGAAAGTAAATGAGVTAATGAAPLVGSAATGAMAAQGAGTVALGSTGASAGMGAVGKKMLQGFSQQAAGKLDEFTGAAKDFSSSMSALTKQPTGDNFMNALSSGFKLKSLTNDLGSFGFDFQGNSRPTAAPSGARRTGMGTSAAATPSTDTATVAGRQAPPVSLTSTGLATRRTNMGDLMANLSNQIATNRQRLARFG